MNSRSPKIDGPLKERLEQVGDDTRLSVEILPLQNRWQGLLRHLRNTAASGIEYNVIDLTSISATLPKWMIERIATRRDVISVGLGEEEK